MNHPRGSLASLPSNRCRRPRANRASTECSHNISAEAHSVPNPSSATAQMPTVHSCDDDAPVSMRRASSTSNTKGASSTSVMIACNIAVDTRVGRSGMSRRPAAWARHVPRCAVVEPTESALGPPRGDTSTGPRSAGSTVASSGSGTAFERFEPNGRP